MLLQLGCPDNWKEGANNTGSDRKINENKALSKAKKWAPYSAKCTTCKAALPKDYQVRDRPCWPVTLARERRSRALRWGPSAADRERGSYRAARSSASAAPTGKASAPCAASKS